jgi:uncharacterized damage-inducible protein DinB
MATGLVGHAVAMARNNIWSNHRLLTAAKPLTQAEFAEKRTSFFPSLRATLNHILWVDTYYIDALLRDPTVLERYCERQTEASLADTIVLPRPNRKPPPTTVISVLEHLFQHQTHHRGQAHAMLAGTTIKPPQLDEFFLAGEQHLRRDELLELGLEPS